MLTRRAPRPPGANLRCQQRASNDFCAEHNRVRPHETLDGAVPADLYESSPPSYRKDPPPLI